MTLKFNKSTDSEHEIKLESSLISCNWRSGTAIIGRKVEFEVITSFVGYGAKIKVTGKTENGKKLGKISDSIRNNKFIGEFEIPEDCDLGDLAFFEVKLPKNSLSGESNRIPVALPVKVTNMKWSADEARRGDTLTLSADVEGAQTGTEATVTIYEYDEDKAHDKITRIDADVKDDKIELMWEYEYHEDTDEIPTQQELERYGGGYNPPEYFFTIKIGDVEYGKNQESGLLNFKDWVEITLNDDMDQPVADEKYVLHLPDGSEKEGTLDANGYAKEEGVPPGAISIDFPDIENISSTQEETG